MISQEVSYRAQASLHQFAFNNSSGSSKTLIDSGDILLNGVSLGALSLNGTTNLQSSASLMRDWVNSVTSTSKVTATAETRIKSTSEGINLIDQVQINGTLIEMESSRQALMPWSVKLMLKLVLPRSLHRLETMAESN